MRDFPMFTTENGVASLILKQIPYWGSAYIRLQKVSDAKALLEECIDFCRAAGADKIYATGHDVLQQYILFSRVVHMACPRDTIADTDAALIPVMPDTLEQWREIYNKKMQKVPNAAYMTVQDANKMLDDGKAYFIHRGDRLLGIGISGGSQIDCVASVYNGAGADIVKALCHNIFEDTVSLEVSTANTKAIALYESLGFIKTGEISAWYKIL